jgi:hypothetical protein
MLLVFFVLILGLISLYVNDYLKVPKNAAENKNIPIKGILVTGALYYLVSKGLISKEEEKMLEEKSLEELEGYINHKNLMSESEWAEICIKECELISTGDLDMDIPL